MGRLLSCVGLGIALAACAPPPTPRPLPKVGPPAPYEVPSGPAVAQPGQESAGQAAAPAVAPRPTPPVDDDLFRVPVGTSPVRGQPTALVTIVEFADLQCPYCGRAEEPLRQVAERYGGDVRVVWKNMPLSFHDYAELAAELALEARAQRGDAAFWKAHDLLLARGGHLDGAALDDVARETGLDVKRALRAVQSGAHRAELIEDGELAEDLGASGTPTFFVNGHRLVGAQPLEAFVPVVEEQLAVARAAVARGVPPGKVYEVLQQGAHTAPLETVDVPPAPVAGPQRGPSDAKVVVQIWSDLECPFCKRVEPTVSDLLAAFPGKVRVVWHNHPLSFHRHAMLAAQAVMEAYAERGADAFWKMHDLLLDHQGGAGQERAAVEQYAGAIGLDLDRFRAALDAGAHRADIEADVRVAEGAGLGATPGFAIAAASAQADPRTGLVRAYRISGALPLSRFKRVVRQALREAR